MSAHAPMPRSAWIFPSLAVLLFAAVTAAHYEFTPSAAGFVFAAILLVILFGTVFAAVHHAEVIAERVGEPYGTLVLTLGGTIIGVDVFPRRPNSGSSAWFTSFFTPYFSTPRPSGTAIISSPKAAARLTMRATPR